MSAEDGLYGHAVPNRLKLKSFLLLIIAAIMVAVLSPSSLQLYRTGFEAGQPAWLPALPPAAALGAKDPGSTSKSNLVRNGGFESETGGNIDLWGIYDWRGNEAITELKYDSMQKRSGSGSAMISSLYANDARIKQTIKVEPDSYYRVSCYVRTEGVGSTNIGANISIEGLGVASKSIKGTNGKWEYIDLIGKTGPGQTELPITLGIGGYSNLNTGKAWFDDVAVVQLAELPEGKNSVDFAVEIKDASGWLKEAANGIMFWFMILLAIILLCFAAFFIILNILHLRKARRYQYEDDKIHVTIPGEDAFGTVAGEVAHKGGGHSRRKRGRRLFAKKDVLICSVMTAIYLAIALFNLGSTKVPETSWTPVRKGESFTIDFGRKVDLDRIYFYFGLGNGKYTIESYDLPDHESIYEVDGASADEAPGEGSIDGSAEGGGSGESSNSSDASSDNIDPADSEYEYGFEYYEYGYEFEPQYRHIKTIEKSEFDEMFIWKYYTVDAKVRTLTVYTDTSDSMIFEMGFFEKGSTEPVTGFTVTGRYVEPHDRGVVENLFDEQDLIEYAPSYRTSTYFDEIYHARTAYEHINRISPYETTHPPLGKVIMALGVLIFGMNPFGWRFMGTLLGAAMIPLMYAFGMKIFKKRFYAVCSAYLLAVDFMHFVQTRIATIDVYCVFFIILMYYFLYDYYIKKSYVLGYKKSLLPLFLSGAAFGLGAASKWIGIYAGAGLALIFFITKFLESRDYISVLRSGDAEKKPSWIRRFVPQHINSTFVWCILFFIVIPAAIYLLSYIPYLVLRNYDLQSVLDNQIYMYKYHSKDVLDATHAYGSKWWSWPIMLRPMWFYGGGDLPEGIASSIVCMGNPAVWWVGMPSMIAAIVISIRKRDRSMLPVFIAAAFQYLPWIFISRVVFIYHFFSTVPFIILSIVYVIKAILEKYPGKRYLIYGYLALAGVLFLMFYPVLSAMEVSRPYVDYVLRWIPGWDF